MRFGIVVFPGTWSDTDCYYVVSDILGQQADYVWHQETDLSFYDCLVLPGGFSYGDYLRAGAIARFSPVMTALHRFVAQGRPVIGICNGFQILCEAGLLPGVLRRNRHLEYRCQWTSLLTERNDTPFSQTARVVRCCKSRYLTVKATTTPMTPLSPNWRKRGEFFFDIANPPVWLLIRPTPTVQRTT